MNAPRSPGSLERLDYKWWVLLSVSTGVFMSTLDLGLVSISLPAILEDLDTSLSSLQWAVLAYSLTISSLLLPLARVADLVGRKRIYIGGIALFSIGNLLAGLARDAGQLTAARTLSGVGGAMLQANSQAIVAAVFPREELGKGLGTYAVMIAAGFAAGPVVGGALTDALGWRSVFLASLPIGLLAVIFNFIVLREDRISGDLARHERFDWAGSLLWGGLLLAVLLALTRGAEWGWTSPRVLVLAALAVLLGAAFTRVELRSAFPTVALSLFRIRGFAAGCSATLFSFVAQQAVMFLMPFYLQVVLVRSARAAGLLMTPVFVAMAVTAPIGGRFADRYGSRGVATIGIGSVALALLASALLTSRSVNYVFLTADLLLVGAGLGLFQAPNNRFVYHAVSPGRYGFVAGFLATTRNVGVSLGVALWGTVVTSVLVSRGFEDRLSVGIIAGQGSDAVLSAFLDGFHLALLGGAAVALLGVVASSVRGSPVQAASRARAKPQIPETKEESTWQGLRRKT